MMPNGGFNIFDSIFVDPVNTVANLSSTSIASRSLAIAKENLDLKIESIEREKEHYNILEKNSEERTRFEIENFLIAKETLNLLKEIYQEQKETNYLLSQLLDSDR